MKMMVVARASPLDRAAAVGEAGCVPASIMARTRLENKQQIRLRQGLLMVLPGRDHRATREGVPENSFAFFAGIAARILAAARSGLRSKASSSSRQVNRA
jgi:hypothetical protein